MTSFPNPGVPGMGSEREYEHRLVCLADPEFLPGVQIDGSLSRDPLNTGDVDVLSAGLLMGKVTASGKYAPSIIGTLQNAHTSDSATSITIEAAAAVELVRRIGSSGTFTILGPPTAGGTVASETYTYTAVNTTTGVVTISTDATDYIAGSFIMPTDGSQTPLGVIGNGHGHKVTDQDGDNVTLDFANLLIGGRLDVSQIRNWPSDTSLITWIKAQLNDADKSGARFTFDDAF